MGEGQNLVICKQHSGLTIQEDKQDKQEVLSRQTNQDLNREPN